MANVLDNLVVKFSGDASGLVRVAKVGARAIGNVARQARKFTSTLAKVGTAGVAAAAAGLTALIQKARGTIDETRKLAANIGTTASEAQQLEFIANLTGTSLDKVSIAMQQVTRSVGDAKRGLSGPIDAFETLGLKLEDLDEASPLDRFKSVLLAMRNLESDTDRASAGATLLGRGWREMAVLVKDGDAVFKRASLVFDRLGLGLDDSNNAVERFNDNLAELGAIGRSLVLKVFEDFGPELARTSDHLVKLARRFILAAGGGGQLARSIKEDLVQAFILLESKLQPVLDFIDMVVEGWRLIFDVMKPVATMLIDQIGPAFEFIKNVVIGFGERLGFLAAFVGQLAAGNISGALAIDREARQQFAPGDETQERQLEEQQQQTRFLETIASGLPGPGQGYIARYGR